MLINGAVVLCGWLATIAASVVFPALGDVLASKLAHATGVVVVDGVLLAIGPPAENGVDVFVAVMEWLTANQLGV